MGRNQAVKPNGVYDQPSHQAKSGNLMEERLRNTILKKREQLAEIEEISKNLRKDIGELNFILGGSTAGGDESVRETQSAAPTATHTTPPIKTRKVYTKRNGAPPTAKMLSTARMNRSNSPDWTPEEDAVLVNFFRGEPKAVASSAKEAVALLPHRSEGAVIQRMYRLSTNGSLRRVSGGGTPGRQIIMEAV